MDGTRGKSGLVAPRKTVVPSDKGSRKRMWSINDSMRTDFMGM